MQRGGSMTSMEDLTPRQRTRASRWISCADPRASVRIMLSCQTNGAPCYSVVFAINLSFRRFRYVFTCYVRFRQIPCFDIS